MTLQEIPGSFATTSLKNLKDLSMENYSAAMRLVDKAKAENRNLTADEMKGYNQHNQIIDLLAIEIEQATKLQERKLMEAGVILKNERADKNEPVSEFRYLDGKPILVADKNRALLEASERPEVRFGDFCRAIATGPRNEAEKRALEGASGSGSYSIPLLIQNDFVDLLRSELTLINAGARLLSLAPGTNRFIKLTADPTAFWHAENASDISLSDPSAIGVDIKAKSVVALVKISRELLQDSVNVAQMIERSAVASLKQALETSIFWGAGGTSNDITGLYNTSGISKGWLGTHGSDLTSYAPLNWADYMLRSNNSKPSAIIASPEAYFAMQSLNDTSGQPMARPSGLADLATFVTTSIPANMTRGTSIDATGMFFGNWADLLIGVVQNAQIELLKEKYADTFSVGFLISMRVDAIALQAKSFCWLGGINTPTTGVLTS